MKEPLISIIITVLNGANTFAQCLESIYEQDFTDYEVILVDGGSTDDSITIFNNSKISNKVLVLKPGISLYAGLNIGIDNASGEWFYFMGCDDVLYKFNTLKCLSGSLRNVTENIISGRVKYSNGYLMAPSTGSPHLMRYTLHHQGTFYKYSVFNTYRYSEELNIAADYELNIRLRLSHNPVKVFDDIIAIYGDNGVSSVQYKRNFKEVGIVNDRLFDGLAWSVVVCCCFVKQRIWMIRKVLGLLNLKARFKEVFKDS